MDDHGDDFGPWGWESASTAVRRTEEEWATIARYIRQAANKVGPSLPVCLPGEPKECGRTAQQHVLAWSAHLKAVAHHLIEQYTPSEARGAHAAGPLYQRRLAALREEDASAHASH
ncbi:hypothetical protein [Streptomyces acidiscabies]|uniref:Uncharacterized protein n=1 Tax=Streptomyces acidiscabies TaxID=42234 RepID=A0AAP6BMV4_9ACTN|nr:hypothetical protein [Streptomyces acidiscabies]MBP5941243.1 hypothetical protein [Streptomyces sp. LBUM 1476]MBZ3912580.1 hypothetical protein [Streptomyces acidiscabies]MDX2967358.1 hypothetical protein [Streptomyces acidiscabies]MDX3018429.1 hypothetical protein [Streptomyces acidiscabies]MDX3796479.1 hypothetical protein [Streptomyces acidiscabies]